MQLTITNADGDRVWSQEVDGTFDLGTIKMLSERGLVYFQILNFSLKVFGVVYLSRLQILFINEQFELDLDIYNLHFQLSKINEFLTCN